MNFVVLLRALAGLSWLAVIGAVVFTVFKATQGQRARGSTTLIIVTFIAASAINLAASSYVFVPPDRLGVVISAVPGQEGVRSSALPSGPHFVVPILENVILYSISSQTYTMSISQSEGQITGDDSVESRTSDGQVVRIDASVIFRINPTSVVQDIHIKWQGGQYVNLLVRPQSRGIIRDAVAFYGIEEVYSTKRGDLKQQIEDEMTIIFAANGLILEDFVLRNIAFSAEYAASVEQKQIAEQTAEQAVFVVQQREQEALQAIEIAEGEKQSRILRAEGEAQSLVIQATADAEARLVRAVAEAEALALLGEAIRANPDILILEYIGKLSPNISVMLLPSDNPFLFPLPEINNIPNSISPN